MPRRALLLAVLLAVAACQHQQPAGFHIDPPLEALVPTGTVFIMGANFDAIRNTQVYQKYSGVISLPRLNEFTAQTGIDPRKDLSQVISVSNGKTGAIIARGKFNQGDVEARLQSKGATRLAYKGHNLFGNEHNAVLFIDSTTVLAGSTPVLKSIFDARDQRHGLPPVLAERVRAIPANAQIWAAFVGGVQALNIGVPENSNLANIVGLLKGIDNAILGIDFSNGLALKASADCKTPADAKRVHDALRGVIGLGRLSTPDNQPELLKLYDAIQVEAQQKQVNVTAILPPDLVNRFIDLWVKRR